MRVGERRIRMILPDIRDPRLHTAAVIISIHVIGITALGFRVSVPQILAAIVTAAVIDIVFTFRRTGVVIWPASGMLTGSGVALILRLVGMEPGDYWSWAGWHYFALVAGLSVLSKYLIRFRGTHVFNPSNIGLVAAFLVLGSAVVEPLDFWWAPLGFWMVVAYLIIVGGGIVITRRLNLAEMAVAFWVALAGGLAVLVASGHCMTAAWSIDPVCGTRFWTVLVTSPEILVFLFFMITDPKTIPRGRLARLVFAATLGLFATLLIAPHTVEFGAKVALLGSLVIWSPIRGVFDRLLPDTVPGRSGMASLVDKAVGRGRRPLEVLSAGAVLGSALVLAAVAIVAAGAPARVPVETDPVPGVSELDVEIDPSTIPRVVIDPGVQALNVDVDEEYARELALALAENLEIEKEAIRQGDRSLLAPADGGFRLTEMQERIDQASGGGARVAFDYEFDSLTLGVSETARGQSGAALAFVGTGTVEEITYDASGVEQDRTESGFETTFVMRQVGGVRWLIVDVTSGNQP